MNSLFSLFTWVFLIIVFFIINSVCLLFLFDHVYCWRAHLQVKGRLYTFYSVSLFEFVRMAQSLQFIGSPSPNVVCDITFVCFSVCICMRLWRCYLCSDKTVNQINLAWKSLSAGPLDVYACVCLWKCICVA